MSEGTYPNGILSVLTPPSARHLFIPLIPRVGVLQRRGKALRPSAFKQVRQRSSCRACHAPKRTMSTAASSGLAGKLDTLGRFTGRLTLARLVCSAALVAYGLESFVDLWASVLVLWRFWEDETTEAGMRKNHDRENRADVGIAFTVRPAPAGLSYPHARGARIIEMLCDLGTACALFEGLHKAALARLFDRWAFTSVCRKPLDVHRSSS